MYIIVDKWYMIYKWMISKESSIFHLIYDIHIYHIIYEYYHISRIINIWNYKYMEKRYVYIHSIRDVS